MKLYANSLIDRADILVSESIEYQFPDKPIFRRQVYYAWVEINGLTHSLLTGDGGQA